jgi:hypothetical protein
MCALDAAVPIEIFSFENSLKDQSWELVDRFTKHLIIRLRTPLALMPP